MNALQQLKTTAPWAIIILVSTLLAWPTDAAAQLKVIISGGFTRAYEELLPEFERTSGTKVTTGSGGSLGTGPQTIAAQLSRGVPADVVILSRDGLRELIATNRIVAGTDVDLAQVPLGVGVRTGAPKPDVSTVEAFKRTLLAAKAVVVTGSTSGIYVTKELLPRLGIADKVNIRVAGLTQARALVAAGDAEIAVMPVSEIVGVAGVDFAATIPSEVQNVQVYTAAVVTGSKAEGAARGLIELLASEHASTAIRKAGMEPLGKCSQNP